MATPNKDLTDAIKGKKKNPRVGIRRQDREGLVMRIGFRVLTEPERVLIIKWYRSGCFTQDELADMFSYSCSIINKAVRGFVVEAEMARDRMRRNA